MLNNSEVIELIQPQPLQTIGKSLGDELLEMKLNKSIKDRRKVQFTELVGRMFLLEKEINSSRYALVFIVIVVLFLFDPLLCRSKLKKSIEKLAWSDQPRTLIRYRMVDGVLTKMMFSKYEGFRVGCI